MQVQQYVRMLPLVLAVCLLATSVPRAQAPAPPPPPSVTKGQAAPNLTASYLTAPRREWPTTEEGGHPQRLQRAEECRARVLSRSVLPGLHE